MCESLITESLDHVDKSSRTGRTGGDEEFIREEMSTEHKGRVCLERRCRGKTRCLWSQMHRRWELGKENLIWKCWSQLSCTRPLESELT